MSKSKKYDLVDVTYEMLKTTSPDKITIRDIAAAADCTSGVIYRHFDNLDHLLLVSSVRFLENYMVDLGEVSKQPLDPIELEITMWQVFADYAFKYVDAFLLMFWGNGKDKLGNTIYEYYEMYPESWQKLNGLYTVVFFNNDLKERNLTILNRAAASGYLKYDDAPLLANIQCNFMYGMLMEYKSTYRNEGVPEKAADEFMQALKSIQSHYRIK